MSRVPLVLPFLLVACLDPNAPGNLVPKTVTEDPALPRIELPDTVLHGEQVGDPDGPLLILLHGGPGGDYRYLLPLSELADDGYSLVFWDHRGAGLSQRHDAEAFTWDVPVEDLRRVIENFTTHPDQPIVFIGHSWGAMYATWFINEHGDYGGRVRGAVLSEPGAFTSEQLDSYLVRLFGSIDFFSEDLNDTTWMEQNLTASDHAEADYLFAISRGSLPAEHVDPDDPEPMWRSGAVVNQTQLAMAAEDGFDWTTHLDAFSPEVLFLRGELNEAMPLWHQEELAAAYPNSHIVTVPNVGHAVTWETHEAFLAETRTYLATLDLSGGAR